MALNNNPTPNEVVKEVKSLSKNKMDKTNPTGSGSFSLNRMSDTNIGDYSFAEGYNTVASGEMSHSEGGNTQATGDASHAEGGNTIASGYLSHVEGALTIAQRMSQHVFGEFNIPDSEGTTITHGKYIEIVGNGSSDTARSNARTLDWNGNETIAGNLKASGLTDGTTTKTMSEILSGGGMKLWRYED